MQLNDLTFAGYLGRDAEDRFSQSGTRIVNFSLCQTEKTKDGKETQTWVNVKVFGNWCDYAATFKKGDNVIVKGKLSISTYTNKDGKEITRVEVLAHSLGLFAKQAKSDSPYTRPPIDSSRSSPQPSSSTNWDDVPF